MIDGAEAISDTDDLEELREALQLARTKALDAELAYQRARHAQERKELLNILLTLHTLIAKDDSTVEDITTARNRINGLLAVLVFDPVIAGTALWRRRAR